MNKKTGMVAAVVMASFACQATVSVGLEGIHASNVRVIGQEGDAALVAFDIAWEDSWRDPELNHDAAWVFFKARSDLHEPWRHVMLAENDVHDAEIADRAGTLVETIAAEDYMGMFVRRAEQGRGPVAASNLLAALRLPAADSIKEGENELRVFAIRMVYVAEGGFAAGSGGTEANRFYAGGTENDPFMILDETKIEIADTDGNLFYRTDAGPFGGDLDGPVPERFPKGFEPFYCMRLPITFRQYTDFLNTLTRTQQATRTAGIAPGRDPLSDDPNAETPAGIRCPDPLPPGPEPISFELVANGEESCNNLSWPDVAAFAAWAGLRPMTELEYEKAARGSREPDPDEFAWGAGTSGAAADEEPPGGNVPPDKPDGEAHDGPREAGRLNSEGLADKASGASYWGILELSGNLWERAVTAGNPRGRDFTGTHGDGKLTAEGEAGVEGWPGADGEGVGFRGGRADYEIKYARVSDRAFATLVSPARHAYRGGRAVRMAPTASRPRR